MRLNYLVGQGLFNFCPTLLALLTLDAADFAHFSYAAIAFSWFISLTLSTVLEVLSPQHWETGVSAIPGLSSTVVWTAGLVAGFLMLLGHMSAGTVASAVIASVLGAQIYTARFVALRLALRRVLLVGDVAGLSVGAVAFVALRAGSVGALQCVLVAWIAAGLTVLAIHRWLPLPASVGTSKAWIAANGRRIAALLGDSTLMDLSALGGPVAIGAVSSPADFGAYRSFQIFVGPLNTALSAVRGIVTGLRTNRFAFLRGVLVLSLVAALATVVVRLLLPIASDHAAALRLLDGLEWPVALVVCGRLVSVPCYFVSRTQASARALLGARLLDAAAGITLPLVGMVAWGLSGAVMCAALSAVISIVIWVSAGFRAADGRTPIGGTDGSRA